MKYLLLVAALAFSSFAHVFAMTDAEIAPAALVGTMLTFTIAYGGAPFATAGVWAGSFAASGNAFTVANMIGNTVNVSTTYSALGNVSSTKVAFPMFIEGQNAVTMNLYTMNGVGYYYVDINGLFDASQNGTFKIGTAPLFAPEISVKFHLWGVEFVDGATSKNIGRVRIGQSSAAKTFTIKNLGTAKLTRLSIFKNGVNRNEFEIGALGKTSLAPGASTTFTVTFKPATTGVKAAAIHISSNDANESPFDIRLTAQGVNP